MEDETVHVVGKVDQRHLGSGAGDADGADDEAHRALLPGKDMLDAGTDARLLRIGRAVRSGIGRPRGFLRWMRLTRPLRLSHFSLA